MKREEGILKNDSVQNDIKNILFYYTYKIPFLSSNIIQFAFDSSIKCLAISPDGKIFISSSNENIRIWDIKNCILIQDLGINLYHTKSLTITPDGKKLISGSYDKTIRIWDLENYKFIYQLKGHSGIVNCLAITPDGKKLISGSDDRTIRIWDLEYFEEIDVQKGHSGDVLCVTPTHDNKHILSGSYDTHIRMWNIDNYKYFSEKREIFPIKKATVASDENIFEIFDMSIHFLIKKLYLNNRTLKKYGFISEGQNQELVQYFEKFYDIKDKPHFQGG